MELTCKNCGVIDVPAIKDVTFKNGTVHREARCKDCGRMIKYLPSSKGIDPLSLMPFGKYKGKTIKEIVNQDQDYARWCAENLDSKKYREVFEDTLMAL